MLTGEEIDDCPTGLENRSAIAEFNINDDNEQGLDIMLGENYPEPFNQFTTIPYKLLDETSGNIIVKDMIGKTVGNFAVSYNNNEVKINTENWQSGVYIYTLEVEGIQIFSKKMILSK
jgi:hypothetical protein